jgi:hypothetical protein
MLHAWVNGIKFTFIGFYLMKFGLHFYLDLTYENYDLIEITKYERRMSQGLRYYKQEESGTRGLFKRICNVCFSISIILFSLWVMIEIVSVITIGRPE